MKTFPKLYKLGSKGQLLEWQISVEEALPCYGLPGEGKLIGSPVGVITTRHGQVGGKIQVASETIKEGKNLGRANATTAVEQAEMEAESEYNKQVSRKGYTPDMEKAKAGGNDQLGVISPMLAHKYTERGKDIRWPSYGQPKLDGIRILASFDGERTELFSRERKPIVGVPHIAAAVTAHCKARGIAKAIFDGEAYNHELKANFGKIVSMVKKLQPGHEIVQYNIYDCPMLEAYDRDRSHGFEAGFEGRHNNLTWALDAAPVPLVLVPTWDLADYAESQQQHANLRALGYEGLMLRNRTGKYAAGARSVDLQKVKEFDEDEFEIIGVEEGVAKFAGLAVFVCKAKNGKEFRCNPPGDLPSRAKWLTDPSPEFRAVGRWLTVQYFGLTDAEQVPRFPVGKAIREGY